MSYRKAMEAAGAIIKEMGEFGSYQGDWWALVEFNGSLGWAHGTFGSCSGCDAFEAEFDYNEDHCSEYRYGYEVEDCEDCAFAALAYQRHLKEFGLRYLNDIMTQEEAEKEAARNIEWDYDAGEMVEFIRRYST